MVAYALQRENYHQLIEQEGRVVNFDSAPEPIDLVALAVADETFVASETADRINQSHRVIEREVRAELISGAFSIAGPLSIGPGFSHRSKSDRVSHFAAGQQSPPN
jgi:hypothetical protein